MAFPNNDSYFSHLLRWLDDNVISVRPLSLKKAEVHTIRLKASFLRVFLSCGGKHNNIEDKHLEALLVHIRTVFKSVDLDIGRLRADLLRISSNKNSFGVLPINLDDLLSSALQNLELLNPDIHEVYTILSKSSRSTIYRDSEATMKDLKSLLKNIEDLLICNAEMVAPVKEELEAAQKSLRFLRDLLAFTSKRCSKLGKLKDLIIHAEFLVDKMSCLFHLCSLNEKMNEMKKHLSSELQNLRPAQPEARQIYIKALKASKSAQGDSAVLDEFDLGFYNSLRDHILELSDTKVRFIASDKDQFLALHEGLRILITMIAMYKPDLQKDIELGFLELDQVSNYFLDHISTVIIDMGCLICSLHNNGQNTDEARELKIAVSNLQDIMKIAKAFKIKTTDETLVTDESSFPKNNPVLNTKDRPAHEKNMTELEIFGEKAKEIRVQLTNGSRKLNIISIVGMPGIGKTTLAESVFQHSSVTYHFHVRAKCSVSQVHDKRRLLIEILQEVTAEKKQYGDDDDVDQKLYQSLKGRRYLILLDDIWSIQAWKDIKSCFPDDEHGSRIIFTSRFEDIASESGLESINFCLSPLHEEKSWEMLQVKLFGNKSCPPELVSAGKEIAANCKGLPLTIDLVAGILRMKERKEWKKVTETMMKILVEDPQGHCRKVLELSYQNLPDDLKPCFLYFAMFPEDANVPTRDLILLWIAEGFVKLEMGERRSLEDEAEDILNKLMRRSLVTVSKRGPLGGVVESRVHDLLHEFAVAKAQEESFMLKIDGKAKFSSVGVCDQWQEQHRLSIYPNYWGKLLEPVLSAPRTRALFNFWNISSLNYGIFKLLRVLYIPQALWIDCPEIFTLIHLKLLVISTSLKSVDAQKIISNIHKLWNLETFIMYRGRSPEGVENLLLDKICNMVRLGHFCYEGYIQIGYLREEIWPKASFANLQTLYTLTASYKEDIEKILKLMPNLVVLKVLLYNPDGDCYPFPKLDFLKKLKSLEVTHRGSYNLCPCNFPPYLKQLVLSNFQVPWMEISEIGNLEHLEVLELKNNAFKGPIWDMVDGQFPKLKYLSLSCLDIEEWNASEDHLSCFEQLHLAYCRRLEQLPSCLAEIGTLQAIKLFNCTEDAENSAKRIKEDQEQMGNEQFVVDITTY